MRVAKHLCSIWVLFLLTGVTSCNTDKSGLGHLQAKERDVVVRNGTQNFDKERWAKAGREARGKMVASLLRSQRFVGEKNIDLVRLLGERTCYIDYEDQPCYELILDDKWYFLVFSVNHSNALGTITGIDLYPRD